LAIVGPRCREVFVQVDRNRSPFEPFFDEALVCEPPEEIGPRVDMAFEPNDEVVAAGGPGSIFAASKVSFVKREL